MLVGVDRPGSIGTLQRSSDGDLSKRTGVSYSCERTFAMAKLELTPELVAKMVADAVAAALANQTAERKDAAITAAKAGKSERSVQNEIAAVKAFKKAGFGDVKPREDVKTYNRWLADGRKVKQGEKAIKVRNLRLFHIKQTEAITAEEKATAVETMQEAIRKHNDKVAAAKAAKTAPPAQAELPAEQPSA